MRKRLLVAIFSLAALSLAACGGGGGGGGRLPVIPSGNGNQQPPPAAFWGDPFIGTWEIHITADFLVNPDNYTGFPATTTIQIARSGDQLVISYGPVLASALGFEESVTTEHVEDVDPQQLNPGGPSDTAYIRAWSSNYGIVLIWYDADVAVGDWIDSYYVELVDLHPRLWSDVLSVGFTRISDGAYITYLGYK